MPTGVHVRFHAVRELSLVPPGTADTAALRYSTIASRSPADSAVTLPLATCRHCFISGQMSLCGMLKVSVSPFHAIRWCCALQYLHHPSTPPCQPPHDGKHAD